MLFFSSSHNSDLAYHHLHLSNPIVISLTVPSFSSHLRHVDHACHRPHLFSLIIVHSCLDFIPSTSSFSNLTVTSVPSQPHPLSSTTTPTFLGQNSSHRPRNDLSNPIVICLTMPFFPTHLCHLYHACHRLHLLSLAIVHSCRDFNPTTSSFSNLTVTSAPSQPHPLSSTTTPTFHSHIIIPTTHAPS
jgi:hypothetical protein